MKEKNKGCLKELRRLKRHYCKERRDMIADPSSASYVIGIIDGLDLAIEVLKNKEFYGD